MASDDTSDMHMPPLAARSPRPCLACLTLGLSLILSGCGESWTRSRDTAILAIERGDDATALQESRRIVRSGPRSMRPEAAYLGGIAAHRLGDDAEAIRLLDIAVTASDSTLRGQALIQRGTVERTMGGRDREAARDLERGGQLLGGDLGSEALLRGAEIYKQLGLEADARRCVDAADRIGGPRHGADTQIAGFTIQFGAFQKKSSAEAHARRIAAAVRNAGLGTVLITEQEGLYKVQVGCYRDIMSAQRMMDRLPTPSVGPVTITAIGP